MCFDPEQVNTGETWYVPKGLHAWVEVKIGSCLADDRRHRLPPMAVGSNATPESSARSPAFGSSAPPGSRAEKSPSN